MSQIKEAKHDEVEDISASSTDGRQDVAHAKAELEIMQKAHEMDPNMPKDRHDAIKHALEHGDTKEILDTEQLLEENSPYEEVRAAVRPVDNQEYANTVRAWVLGMFFVTIGSGLNMFLNSGPSSFLLAHCVGVFGR
ncbi:hypothetical protein Golomagni_07723 [Golovinomyces magnicellulatus]|nr:hypothetical protein Golomagni_07723 [Golovinomyces magnicellulatus]